MRFLPLTGGGYVPRVSVVRLELAHGLARHIRAGHPWVFRRGLQHAPKIPPGSVVDLVEGGRFVARGYFDPHSAIAVRVLTREEGQRIDAAFFRGRMGEAWRIRQELIDLSDTDSFRLVHGEGDGLPGVVVDLYAGFAVLKLYSAGLTPYRPLVVDALKATVPGLRGVLGRDELGRDDAEGDDDQRGSARVLAGGEPPPLIPIQERGARFLVDA